VRILFLSHYFPPEVNAPANRTAEHCRRWVQAGHEVHVVTCTPSHPRGVPFPGYAAPWYRRETIDGIEVHRVWTWLAPNAGVVRRTLNYVSFVPTAVDRTLRLGRFDVIVATSPQFFCAVAGYLSSVLKRTPWVFELRDLWPDSIVAVGAIRPSIGVRLLEKLELAMYRHAEAVVCVTRAFMANLEGRGISAGKLHFVPNGVEMSFWDIDPAAARERLGLAPDAVVASYVGTVGMAHGLGTLLDAARLLQDGESPVQVVVVGEGAELEAVKRRACEIGLRNVSFTGLVARDRARDYVVASDISIVILRDSPLFRTVLPSKLFEAMAAGKPVVLSVPGEAAETLARSGGGVAVPPGDAAALAEAVRRLTLHPEAGRAMGARAREFVAAEFSRDVWAGRLATVLEAVAGEGRGRSKTEAAVSREPLR
jgi:glycosyltransferase involved in cell wall biosynthesis